ncbi:MAG TPA: DUF1080 domain-containing protein [Bryobacteraceae bacterium]|nr:DUF1080 domain-containing protein [Bryobacteraceae bacterium]
MKPLLIGLGLLCLGIAFAQKPNTLSPAEEKQGWKLLFNGKDLTGWQALPTSSPSANGDWRVEDGAIVCPGTSAGWLATADSYSDFHLKLQFRGAERVNSGVFLRSQKEGQPHVTGFELQIWDYQPAGYNTGSLVGAVKAAPTKIRADDWNDYDITADGDHYVIVLNGINLLDTHNSQHAAGLLGFQCQPNNKIEFRDVRVMPRHH